MKCYVGIDLGSTTTKAVFMDDKERILGGGITNSRSDYDLACQIAREEAEINSRFSILKGHLEKDGKLGVLSSALLDELAAKYKLAQYLRQLSALREESFKLVRNGGEGSEAAGLQAVLEKLFEKMNHDGWADFGAGASSRSDFFRDIASSEYLALAGDLTKDDASLFDRLVGVFDRAIIRVESRSFASSFGEYLDYACAEVVKHAAFSKYEKEIIRSTKRAISLRLDAVGTVGTGYGRRRLPFPKRQIRSEILCHGLGAHFMFPLTRTVLDIGGQDTKAIQVDGNGLVTNFQMNDRCAAGCGRYLGYIADEMNIGVHELGPLAMKSARSVRISSTCTVFAGAELRERLSLGEKREDIVAGLHRAIILRAMSLLARSGGVRNEFTFTGGVARNIAATTALRELIRENYGDVKLNISPNSIYTGACGAALFAKRDRSGELVALDVNSLRGNPERTTEER